MNKIPRYSRRSSQIILVRWRGEYPHNKRILNDVFPRECNGGSCSSNGCDVSFRVPYREVNRVMHTLAQACHDLEEESPHTFFDWDVVLV